MTDQWVRWRCTFCHKEGAARGQDQADLLLLTHMRHSHPQLVESESR